MDKELEEALKEYVEEEGWGKTTRIHLEEFKDDPEFAVWFFREAGCLRVLLRMAILSVVGYLVWVLL